MGKTIQHCWADRGEYLSRLHGEYSPEVMQFYDEPGTCLLPRGHAGPHVWTPDNVPGQQGRISDELWKLKETP